MIELIFQSYLSVFLSVGMGCLILFCLGLFWIFKNDAPPMPHQYEDLSVIAGSDVLTTQLDLARAYIESNKHQLAKSILHLVIDQGNALQKTEAKSLLGLI